MLCLHQQENKQIFTPSKRNGLLIVVYQMKNTAREIKQQIIWPIIKDYLSYEK